MAPSSTLNRYFWIARGVFGPSWKNCPGNARLTRSGLRSRFRSQKRGSTLINIGPAASRTYAAGDSQKMTIKTAAPVRSRMGRSLREALGEQGPPSV